MSKLTEKELTLLKAIDESEYGNYLTSEVYTFTIADNSDLSKASIPGIISSLVKKGFVLVSTFDPCGDGKVEETIEITAAGAAAYIEQNGGSEKKIG